jgi:hypothetical protein
MKVSIYKEFEYEFDKFDVVVLNFSTPKNITVKSTTFSYNIHKLTVTSLEGKTQIKLTVF